MRGTTVSATVDIKFTFGARLPLLLQTESTECGLACLGMIAGFYGYRTDLPTLRRRFSISTKGTSLSHLIQFATALALASRPLTLDLEDLKRLRLPCVLHWDLNHFVVLKQVKANGIQIHDPAAGLRTVSIKETSASFTGVALELWPNEKFTPAEERQRVSVAQLVGKIHGLWGSLSQVLLLALALEVCAVVGPLIVQWVVDEGIVSADSELLETLAAGFALLVIIQTSIAAVRSWVLMYVGTTLKVQWRANTFAHLLSLPVDYFEKRHLGDVVSRFGSIDQIQGALTTAFVEGLFDGLMTIVTLGVMLLFSRLLSAIALTAVLGYAVLRVAWYRPLFNATRAQIVFAAKQATHFLESVRGVRAIRLFGREQERRAGGLATLVDQVNAELTSQRLQIAYTLVKSLLLGFESVLILWVGARLVLDGGFTVGALMAFTAYRAQFDGRVANLIEKVLQLRLLRVHAERLADIVLTEPDIGETGAAETVSPAAAEPSISVIDLKYRYGEREPWVLDGVNLHVRAGEAIAVVGASGCGKSTLVHVILGLRRPTSGEVRIGGVDVRRMNPDVLRRMVATVMQDDCLFAGSIADNICFFDSSADREWIEECARLAAVYGEISAMPMGFNSLVGDMGTILSGGQRQRVLLARALYKRPKILVLDEATSQLDIDRERLVTDAIRSTHITRVVIAHRPETVAACDRRVELLNGRIVSDVPVASTSAAQQQVSPRAEWAAAPIVLPHSGIAG